MTRISLSSINSLFAAIVLEVATYIWLLRLSPVEHAGLVRRVEHAAFAAKVLRGILDFSF